MGHSLAKCLSVTTSMDSRSFYESQYPVLIISRIMGLAPFSVNLDAPSTEWVRLSIPWLIYSLALYGGYLYTFVLCSEISWKVPLQRNYPFISVIGRLLINRLTLHSTLPIVILFVYTLPRTHDSDNNGCGDFQRPLHLEFRESKANVKDRNGPVSN